MEEISVVICTYNRYELLIKAIESVLNQTLSNKKYELIIVDNTPIDKRQESIKLAKKYNKLENVQYIYEDTPGLSNARNIGYQNAKYDIVSYLDDDAIASPEWLEEILLAFSSFPKVGIVGGDIKPIWSKPQPKWLKENLLGYVSVVDWGGEMRIASENEWFAGANISFSKKILVEKGGFSTSLGRVGNGSSLMSNEENELIEFTKSRKYNLVYNPKAYVDHLVEEKRISRSWFRKRMAWQATSDFILDDGKNNSNRGKNISMIREYLSSLPPLYRNIQGFYYETEDYGTFRWQLSAIYEYTYMMLNGFNGLEGEFEND